MAARITPSSLRMASLLQAVQGTRASLVRSGSMLHSKAIFRINHGPVRALSLYSPLRAKLNKATPKKFAHLGKDLPSKPPPPEAPKPHKDLGPKITTEYRPTRVRTAPAPPTKGEARQALFYRIFSGPFKYFSYAFFAYLGLSTGLAAFHLYNAPPFHTETLPSGALPTGQPTDLRHPSQTPTSPSDFDALTRKAELFDIELAADERVSGISGLRAKLAARVHGDVLEVASGTGRNFGYYDWSGIVSPSPSSDTTTTATTGMTSFTALDISDSMLLYSRNALRTLVPGLAKVLRAKRTDPLPPASGPVLDVLDSRVRLFKADAQDGALPGPEAGGRYYDTVIQTFGLCSVSDPVKLLANVASVVRPGTGRILLMDHGRGWWERFNRAYLDRLAVGHFEKYGCWWNRDIEGLVREAARTVPGLEIVSVERPWWPIHLGTTCVTELRVREVGVEGGKVEKSEETKRKEEGKGWRGMFG